MIWLAIFGIISFFVTFITLPSWIHRARETGFVGKDVHKNDQEVAELGGITVILGIVVSVSAFVAFETFYLDGASLIFIISAVATILIATMIGMTDDMLGWRIGLRQGEKVLLTLLVPIPMIVVNAGHSVMKLPFIGQVELGLLYPLVVIPLGVIGATNGYNMLAGFNGLEAGLGVVILSTLAYLALRVGAIPAAVIAICFVASMLAFLCFNRYPSKVFPGDVFTYPVGAAIAIVAILADLERFAMMLFIPYYLEFILKARGRFKPEWEATVLEDDSLAVKDRLYSVPHVAISLMKKIKGTAHENEIVFLIIAFEVVIAIITVYSF
jgi:UDP-N-acetylglucosamine--dolichyl-phosphate N-acetylglucosaminephosphotransferase